MNRRSWTEFHFRIAELVDHGTFIERILAVFMVSLPAAIWWRFDVIRESGWLAGIVAITAGCAIESALFASCWIIIDKLKKQNSRN